MTSAGTGLILSREEEKSILDKHYQTPAVLFYQSHKFSIYLLVLQKNSYYWLCDLGLCDQDQLNDDPDPRENDNVVISLRFSYTCLSLFGINHKHTIH